MDICEPRGNHEPKLCKKYKHKKENLVRDQEKKKSSEE